MFGPRARPNSKGLKVTPGVSMFLDTGFLCLCDPSLLLLLMVTVDVVLVVVELISIGMVGTGVPPIQLLVCARGAHTCS